MTDLYCLNVCLVCACFFGTRRVPCVVIVEYPPRTFLVATSDPVSKVNGCGELSALPLMREASERVVPDLLQTSKDALEIVVMVRKDRRTFRSVRLSVMLAKLCWYVSCRIRPKRL